MKRRAIIAIALLVVTLGLGAGGYLWYGDAEADFQAAADAKRINDVHRIAALVEAYREVRGYYPLVDRIAAMEEPIPIAVNITDLELPAKYNTPPAGQRGLVLPMEELLAELRAALGDDIELPFDPQKVGVHAPNFYQYLTSGTDYFVSANLYEPTPNTREIAPHYHKYQVSSTSAPEYAIRRFEDIPRAELEAARRAGEAAERSFWYLERNG